MALLWMGIPAQNDRFRMGRSLVIVLSHWVGQGFKLQASSFLVDWSSFSMGHRARQCDQERITYYRGRSTNMRGTRWTRMSCYLAYDLIVLETQGKAEMRIGFRVRITPKSM